MTSRQMVRTSRLSSVLSAVVVPAVLLAVVCSAAPEPPCVSAGPAARFSMSGFIVPLDESSVKILSADIDIRLPKWDTRIAAIRMGYEMVNQSETATTLRVGMPIYSEFGGLPPRGSEPPPVIKFDGAPVEYSCPTFHDLAQPHLEQLAEKGWELLEATDPALKAQLEALRQTEGEVSHEVYDALREHVVSHPERWGEQARFWRDDIVEFLVFRHLYEFGQYGPPSGLQAHDVQNAMNFLDPEHTPQTYDVERLMLEQWGLNVPFLYDPYDHRLYVPTSNLGQDFRPRAKSIRVLEFEITFLPGQTHHLAIFYRQAIGYDRAYRAGERSSRQFCFACAGAHKWHDWGDRRWPIHWTIRWPEGIRQIEFRPVWYREKRYWQEDGYHNASYSTTPKDYNLHIAWIN